MADPRFYGPDDEGVAPWEKWKNWL
jgi:hypothetical protein